MKFPVTYIDRDQYFQKILALLNDEGCLLFIDTNILAMFFKLNAEARKELLIWMSEFTEKDRLKTPTWALNEYTKRFIRKRTGDYLSTGEKLKTVIKEFKEVRKFLSMHIDEESLKLAKYPDRPAYIEDLDKISTTLEKVSSPLKNKKLDYIVKINEDLQKVLESTVIESDIFNLVEPIGNYGVHRFRTELPPGFEDGHKDFNAYGDLIIWQEILAYCKARTCKKVLILTNDQKPDWMYAPYQLQSKGRRVPNNEPELKIADPRLIYEFRLATFSEELYIINMETLTKISIDDNRKDLLNVARALQLVKEDETSKEESGTGPDSQMKTSNENAQTSEQNAAAASLIEEEHAEAVANEGTAKSLAIDALPASPKKPYSDDALADVSYISFLDPKIGDIVEKLKSHSWYTQNPAIDELVDYINRGYQQILYNDDLFVLGRNIYQSATGGAYSAIDMIENKLSSLAMSFKLKSHIVAGMFYEIYFNSHGYFRGNNLKSYLVSDVFAYQTETNYADAISFIASELQDNKDKLFVLPNSTPSKVTVELDVKDVETSWAGPMLEVQDLKVEGESVLRYSDIYYHHRLKQVSSESNIKEQIESVFAIPASQQILKSNSSKSLPYLFRNNAILWRGDLPPEQQQPFTVDF